MDSDNSFDQKYFGTMTNLNKYNEGVSELSLLTEDEYESLSKSVNLKSISALKTRQDVFVGILKILKDMPQFFVGLNVKELEFFSTKTTDFLVLVNNKIEELNDKITQVMNLHRLKNSRKVSKDNNAMSTEVFNILKGQISGNFKDYLNKVFPVTKFGELKKPYLWTYFQFDANEEIDKIDINGGEVIDKIILIVKVAYFVTKLTLRSTNILRFTSLMNDIEGRSNLAKISSIAGHVNSIIEQIEKLFFTEVSEVYVSSDLEMTTVFTSNLGNYVDSFYKHMSVDSKGKVGRKIKTETLLKYLIFCLKNMKGNSINDEQLFTKILEDVQYILTMNKDTIELEKNHLSSIASNLLKSHNEINDIYTFVKLRSDQGLPKINKRFNYTVDIWKKNMTIEYDDIPKKFYSAPEKYLIGEEKTIENRIKGYQKYGYPYSFLFGPFTYIFDLPTDSNKKIAEYKDTNGKSRPLAPLMDKLLEGKSVCIIGYGASGSGKTSALIYDNHTLNPGEKLSEEDRQGISIHMCKMLSKKYNQIELSFLEIEADIAVEPYIEDHVIVRGGNEEINPQLGRSERKTLDLYSSHIFNYDGKSEWNLHNQTDKVAVYINEDGELVWEGSSKNVPIVPKSEDNKDEEEDYPAEEEEEKEAEIKVRKTPTLGQYMLNVMDKRRNVKATPNNPVSSRSHMIIFIKLKNSTDPTIKSPFLIICDFAGVENEFQCSVTEVLNSFKNIELKKCKVLDIQGNCIEKYKAYEKDADKYEYYIKKYSREDYVASRLKDAQKYNNIENKIHDPVYKVELDKKLKKRTKDFIDKYMPLSNDDELNQSILKSIETLIDTMKTITKEFHFPERYPWFSLENFPVSKRNDVASERDIINLFLTNEQQREISISTNDRDKDVLLNKYLEEYIGMDLNLDRLTKKEDEVIRDYRNKKAKVMDTVENDVKKLVKDRKTKKVANIQETEARFQSLQTELKAKYDNLIAKKKSEYESMPREIPFDIGRPKTIKTSLSLLITAANKDTSFKKKKMKFIDDMTKKHTIPGPVTPLLSEISTYNFDIVSLLQNRDAEKEKKIEQLSEEYEKEKKILKQQLQEEKVKIEDEFQSDEIRINDEEKERLIAEYTRSFQEEDNGFRSKYAKYFDTEKYKIALESLKQFINTTVNNRKIKQYNEETKEHYKKKIEDYKRKKEDLYVRICKDRVKEGKLINSSLKMLRTFISYFITQIKGSGSITHPKFINQCLPIQGNPNFEEFFGLKEPIEKEQSSGDPLKESIIAIKISEALCSLQSDDGMCTDFKDLVFCIFNVINLSQTSANNPPPIPYIFIGNLINELNRLESINYMVRYKGYEISDILEDHTVYVPYLENILRNPLIVFPPETKSFVKEDENIPQIPGERNLGYIKKNDAEVILKALKAVYNADTLDTSISTLSDLINVINSINSLTTIGTMEFTDMMAKYGLNKSTCVYKNNDYELQDVKTGEIKQYNDLELQSANKRLKRITDQIQGGKIKKEKLEKLEKMSKTTSEVIQALELTKKRQVNLGEYKKFIKNITDSFK